MDATFSIVVDAEQNLVRIGMAGFFTTEDIGRFAELLDRAHRQLGGHRSQHVTLVDIRGMKIQTQDSVAGFARLLSDPNSRTHRIAFVVEASLARMQLQRAAAGRGGRFFPAVEEAEAWLLEQDGPAQAAA